MKVKKKAIREFISTVLDDYLTPTTQEEPPVNVNAVVDPSAAVTDPIDSNFKPQTKQELDVALGLLTKQIPIGSVPKAYDDIKSTLDAMHKSQEKEDNKMNDKQDKNKVEEIVRLRVRKMLSEMGASKSTKAFKPSAIGTMTDVSGASFEEIAKELNFSVAGAKQAVDKALEKAKFVATKIDPDDLEIVVLNAMNDYIKMLNKSGEISPSDVQLMKDHPEIVRELDGFREFLHNYVRRARKSIERGGAPVEESKKQDKTKKPLLTCPDCKGSGWDERNDKDCEYCVATGKVFESKKNISEEVSQNCDDCGAKLTKKEIATLEKEAAAYGVSSSICYNCMDAEEARLNGDEAGVNPSYLDRLESFARNGEKITVTSKGKISTLWKGLGNRSGLHSYAGELLREKWDEAGQRFLHKIESFPKGTKFQIHTYRNINRDRGSWKPAVVVEKA